MSRKDQIVEFVTERFIQTGAWSTVKEIAAGIGVSESTIRKEFVAANGCFAEFDAEQDSRTYADKSYPGRAPDHIRKVWVYAPTRQHMAGIIKTSRIPR
jgi:hypothetical protein